MLRLFLLVAPFSLAENGQHIRSDLFNEWYETNVFSAVLVERGQEIEGTLHIEVAYPTTYRPIALGTAGSALGMGLGAFIDWTSGGASPELAYGFSTVILGALGIGMGFVKAPFFRFQRLGQSNREPWINLSMAQRVFLYKLKRTNVAVWDKRIGWRNHELRRIFIKANPRGYELDAELNISRPETDTQGIATQNPLVPIEDIQPAFSVRTGWQGSNGHWVELPGHELEPICVLQINGSQIQFIFERDLGGGESITIYLADANELSTFMLDSEILNSQTVGNLIPTPEDRLKRLQTARLALELSLPQPNNAEARGFIPIGTVMRSKRLSPLNHIEALQAYAEYRLSNLWSSTNVTSENSSSPSSTCIQSTKKLAGD